MEEMDEGVSIHQLRDDGCFICGLNSPQITGLVLLKPWSEHSHETPHGLQPEVIMH